MYCTGGIRCEKASSYMLDQGFKEVYHLEGGILKYMEDTPVVDSKWQGNCFVFDERVALDHDLQPSGHKQCYGCRHPLTAAEFSAEETIAGVCCPYCVNVTTTEQKQRYKERQKQISLANKRGEQHLG